MHSAKKCLLFPILFGLASCLTTDPPDVIVCQALTPRTTTDPATGHSILSASTPACEAKGEFGECGHCVYIVSGKDLIVGERPENRFSGKSWQELKLGSIIVPATDSYEPLITYLSNGCRNVVPP